MHIDLSCKHVVQASRVLLQNLLVVFAWKLIHKNFQPPHWVIVQDITSTTCIVCKQTKLKLIPFNFSVDSESIPSLQTSQRKLQQMQKDKKKNIILGVHKHGHNGIMSLLPFWELQLQLNKPALQHITSTIRGSKSKPSYLT